MTTVTTEDLAPLRTVMASACPPTLREIAENLYIVLIGEEKEKPEPERALELANLALLQLDRLCSQMGGMNWYLNKAAVLHLSKRNRAMCAKFRGDYRVLAREYDLTEQQVRNIVDAWQNEEFLKRQNPLFEDAPVSKKTR